MEPVSNSSVVIVHVITLCKQQTFDRAYHDVLHYVSAKEARLPQDSIPPVPYNVLAIIGKLAFV